MKLGLVRENYEFGFGPIAFEQLSPRACPAESWKHEPDGRSTEPKEPLVFLESGGERGVREKDGKGGIHV